MKAARRPRAAGGFRLSIISNREIIGEAAGSIIATIMIAHMRKTAIAGCMGHCALVGIISTTQGWPMSSVIQATNAHPAAPSNPSNETRWARSRMKRSARIRPHGFVTQRGRHTAQRHIGFPLAYGFLDVCSCQYCPRLQRCGPRETVMTPWEIKATEFVNCNRSYGCPCQFNAPPTHGNCEAAGAFRIDEGY